jgi:hypothetical protein
MPTRPDRTHSREPDLKPPAPAVNLTTCPNCGRKEVAVFPVLRPDKPDDTAKFVCTHCCPKTSTGR